MAYESASIKPGDTYQKETRHRVDIEVRAIFHPLGIEKDDLLVATKVTPQRVYHPQTGRWNENPYDEKSKLCYIRQSPENHKKIRDLVKSLKTDLDKIQEELLGAFARFEAMAADRVQEHNARVKPLMDGEDYLYEPRGEPGKPVEPRAYDRKEFTLGHIGLLGEIHEAGGSRRIVECYGRRGIGVIDGRIKDLIYGGLATFSTEQIGCGGSHEGAARTVVLTAKGKKAAKEGPKAIHWLGDIPVIQDHRERDIWDGLDPD